MFSRYYQSELTYLRELGREFAASNPALAGLFADRGGDPDVERLLEGFAFLAARIRERLDDAVPEVVEQLSQLALPQYLRTIPATSIVEFSPNIRALKGVHRVARGAELGTRAIAGCSCIFRTSRDLELLPVQITGVALEPTIESAPRVRIQFQTTEVGASVVRQVGKLRLFLNAALPQASTLFLWMTRHLTGVEVETPGAATRKFDARAVRPASLSKGSGVFPWPAHAPDDLRLVLEYYTQPPLLLFVDLVIEGLDVLGETFDVVFQFDRPPRLPERLERETFRLHCVPVVNLFDATAEPVRRETGANEYLVRAAGLGPVHADVFEIRRATGARPKSPPFDYSPYFDFSHMSRSDSDQHYFWTRRAISPIDGGLDTYVAFGTPRDLPPESSDEVVSLELTCTNRALPAELRTGDINQSTSRSPTVAPFKNIIPISRPVRPPIGTEMHWRFIAHIAVNQRSLSDPSALRAILGLYNLHESVDVQLGRANRLRVDAIRTVRMEPAKRLIDHIPTRGVRTTLELDETAFASLGDLYVFGCTLDEFFASQAPINTFHELSVLAHPSGRSLSWTPRSGIEPVY